MSTRWIPVFFLGFFSGLLSAAIFVGCQGASDSYHEFAASDEDQPAIAEENPAASHVSETVADVAPAAGEPVSKPIEQTAEVAVTPPVETADVIPASAAAPENAQEPVVDLEPAAKERENSSLQVAAATTVAPSVASGSPSAATAPGSPNLLPGAQTADLLPKKPMLLVKERDFTKGPDGTLRVSYDDIDLLKVLNMDPVTPDAVQMMPSWLRNLDGKRIRIRGFMYPTFIESGITEFVLARDNEICCFGRDPKIYDLIHVLLREGQSTKYIQNRPFDVVGTFRIEPLIEGGKYFGLYRLEDAQVIDK